MFSRCPVTSALAATAASLALAALPACSSAPFDNDPVNAAPASYGESSNLSHVTHPRAREFTGLSLAEAMTKAESLGLDWRIIRRDGQTMGISGDTNPDRLNFTVVNSKVVVVTRG